MKDRDGLETVPREFTADALWRMEVCRLALFLADLSRQDSTKLMQDQRTLRLAGQLCSAVRSISTNTSGGYSRQFRRDQARYHESALDSARNGHGWYDKGCHVPGETVTAHRPALTIQIIRHLLRIVPAERGPMLKEDSLPSLSSATSGDPEVAFQSLHVPEPPLDAPRTT